MGDFAKAFARLSADSLGGRIGREKLGIFLFEGLQLAHQCVVFGVADLGLILHVVLIFVVPDLIPQALGNRSGRRCS